MLGPWFLTRCDFLSFSGPLAVGVTLGVGGVLLTYSGYRLVIPLNIRFSTHRTAHNKESPGPNVSHAEVEKPCHEGTEKWTHVPNRSWKSWLTV